jgi:hypothetical protein
MHPFIEAMMKKADDTIRGEKLSVDIPAFLETGVIKEMGGHRTFYDLTGRTVTDKLPADLDAEVFTYEFVHAASYGFCTENFYGDDEDDVLYRRDVVRMLRSWANGIECIDAAYAKKHGK